MFRWTLGHWVVIVALIAGGLALLVASGSILVYGVLVAGFFVGRVALGVGRLAASGEPLSAANLFVLLVGSAAVANLCAIGPVAAFWMPLLLLWGRLAEGGSILLNYAVAFGTMFVVNKLLANLFLRVPTPLEPNLDKVLFSSPAR